MLLSDLCLIGAVVLGFVCVLVIDRMSGTLTNCRYQEFHRQKSRIEFYSLVYAGAVLTCVAVTTITGVVSALGLVGFHLYKRS